MRFDNTVWWCPENRPNPYLIEFHLRNSVFAHCRGAAETSDSDDETSGDEGEVALARHIIMDFFGEGELERKMAGAISADTLVDMLEE